MISFQNPEDITGLDRSNTIRPKKLPTIQYNYGVRYFCQSHHTAQKQDLTAIQPRNPNSRLPDYHKPCDGCGQTDKRVPRAGKSEESYNGSSRQEVDPSEATCLHKGSGHFVPPLRCQYLHTIVPETA